MDEDKRKHETRGILIELLIAIIIIAVFALMLVPGLNKWVNKTIANGLFKDAVSVMNVIEDIAKDPKVGEAVRKAKNIKELAPETKEKILKKIKLAKVADADISWEFEGDKLKYYKYKTEKYKITYDGNTKKWRVQKIGKDEKIVALATIFYFLRK